MKTIYIIILLAVFGIAFYEQSKPNPSVWVQVIGVIVFFYGAMKLMSKTSSNHKDKEEDV
ncbi:hypothetical protein ABGT15_06140 [Flavobacterium enshiense]|uniref:hypothetical protein n=1 Tax=Flavobacterium enshiense TaxID=1341165 RepID=UPI00345CF46E